MGGFRVKILGHRLVPGGRVVNKKSDTGVGDSDSPQGIYNTFLVQFSQAFRLQVADRIATRIRSGRLHRSRNRRFKYQRAWVLYRYGSDRARKASPGVDLKNPDGSDGGFARSFYASNGERRQGFVRRSQLQAGQDAMPQLLRDPFMLAQFRFIASRLMRRGATEMAPNTPNKNLREKDRDVLFRDGRGNTFAVTEAVSFLSKELIAYRELKANEQYAEMRRRMQENAYEFFDKQRVYLDWSRNSKAGQRLLRQAQRYAVRAQMSKAALGNRAQSEGQFRDSSKYAPERDQLMGRHSLGTINDKSGVLKARLAKEQEQVYKGDRSNVTALNFEKAGKNFAFGFQTGTLANAWENAQFKLSRMKGAGEGMGYQLLLEPDESGASPGTPGAGRLTHILQNIMRRQGNPDPRLLTRPMVREAVKEALQNASAANSWARRGIRLGYGKRPR